MEAEDIVGICYQAMTAEGIKDLASAVLRSRVHKLVKLLWLVVVKIYKCTVNPITNPNTVSQIPASRSNSSQRLSPSSPLTDSLMHYSSY
jgi:hypothetical protein